MKRIYPLLFLLLSNVSFAQWQLDTLHCFTYPNDGREPQYGNLISDGTFLYGMTSRGGTIDSGTIFKIKPDGSSYSKIFDFNYSTGKYPLGSLLYDGTYLYGMTSRGGIYEYYGTLFKIKTDGTGFSVLLYFNGATNGSGPPGALISDGIYLYGMTIGGGLNGKGTIFKIKTDGTGYLKLLDFGGAATGEEPYGSLVSDGTFLYGVASQGGTSLDGTVFKIKSDGTNFVKLLDFYNSIGRGPNGSLIYDGSYLYGTTESGGAYDSGTVYKIRPDGSNYTRLHDFRGDMYGHWPHASLVSDGYYLYGTTDGVGGGDYGTVFRIRPDGSNYNVLTYFNPLIGIFPYGSLYTDSVNLYGMTFDGGPCNYCGTIFKVGSLCTIPSSQSTNITFTNVTSSSATLNWTNGNGARRIVKIKPTNTFTAPANGNDYTANSVYSGSGEQVVYNGTGSSVTVTGLHSNTWYWFRVYEASCSGSNSLYYTSGAFHNPWKVFTQPFYNSNRPESESDEGLSQLIQVYPNPTTGNITVESADSAPIQRLTLYSSDGRIVKAIVNCPLSTVNLDLEGLSAGIYFLDCITVNGSERVKVVKY